MPHHRRSKRRRLRDVSLGTYLTKKYAGAAGRGIDWLSGKVSNLANAAGEFFGMGDYEVRGNSLLKFGGDLAQDAVITPQGPRAICIKYKEYLTDIFTGDEVSGTGTSKFHLNSFLLNPGISSTFPWLSPIAQQYEQWSPQGIVFEFRSTASSYSVNTQLGRIVMATDYDVYDADYANLTEMLQSAFSNERKLDTPRIVHGVECDPADTPNRIFYVTQSGNLSGLQGSAREYLLGKFQIATVGCPVFQANVGSLYIHYDICLRKEQLYNGLPLKGAMTSMYKWGSSDAQWPQLFFKDDTTPFAVFNSINDLGITATRLNDQNLVLQFPAWVNNGTFLVEIQAVVGVITGPAVGYWPYAQLIQTTRAPLQIGQNDYGTAAGDSRVFSFGSGSTATYYRCSGIFNIQGAPASIVLSQGNVSTEGHVAYSCVMAVTQVSGRTFGGL